MIPFLLSEAVSAVSGEYFGDPALLSEQVCSVVIDSRKAAPHALYVPIIGQIHDGHRFIPAAMEQGALAVLSDRPLTDGTPHILVSDTTEALQRLAEAYLLAHRIPIIGITGSVGKTTTKEMLYTVLSRRFSAFKTPGNLNNQTGVPQAVFQLEKAHDLAILELGTNHPGEIRALARIVRPDICLITNIGVAHIEFFGSREGIFRGKTEMLEYMQPGGSIIVNGDDDLLSAVPDAICFGLGENNAVRAVNLKENGLSGTEFTLVCRGDEMPMRVPAPGRHMVYNALAAVAVGLTLGMTLEELREGLLDYAPSAGRMEIKRTKRFTVLDDSYNANPTSVMAALDVLQRAECQRRVCILGDMLELGPDSDAFHEVVGLYAARHDADLILAVGPNAEGIFRGADALRPGRCFYFETPEALHAALPSLLRDDDTILVKASRGMHLEHTVALLETL